MKTFASSLLSLAVTVLAANSTLSHGQQAEKRLGDASSGYSFAVPTGFKSQQTDEGFGLVNPAQTIAIVVKTHDFQTFDKFMAQSNLESDGFSQLGKVQDVGEKGKTFRVAKQTPQGALIVDTFVLFSPYGAGALVVAFSDTANNKESFQTASQIANSVAFAEPQTSGAEIQWQMFLRGKHLTHASTSSGGGSERKDIYLCPSGKFFYHSEFLSNSVIGSGVVASKLDGGWKVSARGEIRLVLHFSNGRVDEYKVVRGQSNEVVVLNGKRYLAQTLNQCP